MAYTPHGHYIRGSVDDEARPKTVARCGGPGLCGNCSTYITQYYNKMQEKLESSVPDPATLKNNYPEFARRLVYLFVKSHLEVTDTHVQFDFSNVYVVWHCKTLQHWKALVSTSLPNGNYYEVTHNGDKKETYIDTYTKLSNIVIPDDVL